VKPEDGWEPEPNCDTGGANIYSINKKAMLDAAVNFDTYGILQ